MALEQISTVKFRLEEDDYISLINIYNQKNHTKQDFKTFSEILAKAIVNNNIKLVRFLGDMLADRGKNDYFILLLLKFLGEKAVNYEILFSNHDAIFIHNYEKSCLNKLTDLQSNINAALSLVLLVQLIEDKIIDIKIVKEIFNNFYKPKLKLLSYTINLKEDGNTEFTIFSHAPICLSTIRALANKFGILYPENLISYQLLATCIDQINKIFCGKKTIIENYAQENYPPKNDLVVPLEYPVTRTIWNRSVSQDTFLNELPFKLTFVHGHHSAGINKEMGEGYLGLDSSLGKSPEFFKGTLLSAHSTHSDKAITLESNLVIFSSLLGETLLTKVSLLPSIISDMAKLNELSQDILFQHLKKICLNLAQLGESTIYLNQEEKDKIKSLCSQYPFTLKEQIINFIRQANNDSGQELLPTITNGLALFSSIAESAVSADVIRVDLESVRNFIKNDLKPNTPFRLTIENKINRIKQHGEKLLSLDKKSTKSSELLGLARNYRDYMNEYFLSSKQDIDKKKIFDNCKKAYNSKKQALSQHRLSKSVENFLIWLAGTATIGLAYIGKAIYSKITTGKASVFNNRTHSEYLVKSILELEKSNELKLTSASVKKP